MNGAMPTAAFGLAIRRVLLAIAYEVIAKRCSLARFNNFSLRSILMVTVVGQ